MKTIALFLTILLTQCSAKQNESTTSSEIENENNQQAYEIKLKKVTADSRCPEGLNCVWEGQVEMIVTVYQAEKLIEEKELIINSQTTIENATWANQYSDKKITYIGVTPNRLKDEPIEDSDYKLLIKYN